ncbi:hypothetical protein JCM5350_002548 [Sporobolomyces pararoseus]
MTSNNTNTRLLITSLHPSVTSQHLRSHLSQCPQLLSPASSSITDVKVVTRKDGTSRCLAFVGFKDGKQAEKVLEWSKGSWLNGTNGGSRIRVDWAKDTRDAESTNHNNNDRATKRQKLDPTTKSSKKNDISSSSSDSRFKDFLAVMQPAKPSTLHDTTELSNPSAASSSVLPSTSVSEKKKSKPTSTRPPPPPSKPEPETETETQTETTEGFMSFPLNGDDVAGDETLTDAEYLAKRMKRNIDQVDQDPSGLEEEEAAAEEGGFEQDEEEKGDKQEEEGEGEAKEEEDDLTIQSILETGRLFLRNLAFSATQEDLESLFSGFGQIEQVHLPVDKSTQESKGLGYVTFSKPEQAVEAYKVLDGRTFQGRLLHILPAVGRAPKPDTRSRGEEGNSLKKERMEMRKQVGGKSFSWGTLYLNSNAALSAVADRLGVSKAELLDPTSSSDPAIKVALAEAHTIGEIKQYFENEGVNLEAFSSSSSSSSSSSKTPIARSSTCILLKNLPYSTSLNSLKILLEPFGEPSRILIPPSGTIAIVDFPDKKMAQDCWRGLLYKNFGGNVLYLEKAPLGIWENSNSSSTRTNDSSTTIKPVQSTSTSSSTTTTTTTNNQEEASSSTTPSAGEVGATLFIKNLNFITTTQRLQQTFSYLPGFSFARVQTKPDPHTPGKTLSMGYGFIGFKTLQDARNGLKSIETNGNLKVLDGHELEIKFAQRGTISTTNNSKSKSKGGSVSETTTKMLVKNVPFEATRKELRQLFSAYGQLKSVRLPKKMDNSTRGFAFLDFATRRDAESAFSALEHAHLLGRHLVLQWAGEGDEDEEGGGKGAKLASFETGRKNLTHKKSKFTMDTE